MTASFLLLPSAWLLALGTSARATIILGCSECPSSTVSRAGKQRNCLRSFSNSPSCVFCEFKTKGWGWGWESTWRDSVLATSQIRAHGERGGCPLPWRTGGLIPLSSGGQQLTVNGHMDLVRWLIGMLLIVLFSHLRVGALWLTKILLGSASSLLRSLSYLLLGLREWFSGW